MAIVLVVVLDRRHKSMRGCVRGQIRPVSCETAPLLIIQQLPRRPGPEFGQDAAACRALQWPCTLGCFTSLPRGTGPPCPLRPAAVLNFVRSVRNGVMDYGVQLQSNQERGDYESYSEGESMTL